MLWEGGGGGRDVMMVDACLGGHLEIGFVAQRLGYTTLSTYILLLPIQRRVQLMLLHHSRRKHAQRPQRKRRRKHRSQRIHIRAHHQLLPRPLLQHLPKIPQHPRNNLSRRITISQPRLQEPPQRRLEHGRPNGRANRPSCGAEEIRRRGGGCLLRVFNRGDEGEEADGELRAVACAKEEEVEVLWRVGGREVEGAEEAGAEVEERHGEETEAVVAAGSVHDEAGTQGADRDADGEGHEVQACREGGGAAEHRVEGEEEVLGVLEVRG